MKYDSDRAGRPDALLYVPNGCSFGDIRKLRGTKDIGEGIDKAIAGIADPAATRWRNRLCRVSGKDRGAGPGRTGLAGAVIVARHYTGA